MGILDDAIRQHLELKRQHGAPGSDLDRLEQEAFGPATRPGDPEFETGEKQAPEAGGESPAAPAESGGDRPMPEWFSSEDPTTVEPQAATEAPAKSAEPESVEQPIPVPEDEPPEAPEGAIFDVEDVDLGEIDIDIEPSPAERARSEHSELEDTVDHPAPKVESLSEELEAAAPQSESPPVAPPVEEPGPGDPEVPSSVEEPESIEFEQLPGEGVAPAAASADDDESDEDLLEETPDFLKDAPDGEDLWFEQGRPKDFDFDD